jgi:SAM-dependent methyltransferase
MLRRLLKTGRAICPCCGARFRRGAIECPRCRSRARHRLLWLYLSGEYGIEDRSVRILHFAPERAIEQLLRPLLNATYVSTDLQSPRADVKADITGLPFEDGEFDLVLCSHVLEHIADDRAAMRELYRVLAPGGTAIVQSPVNYDQAETFEDPSVTSPEERLRLFSQPDHVRVYGPDLKDRLIESGFTVTVQDCETATVERHALQATAPLRNDLYLATKP